MDENQSTNTENNPTVQQPTVITPSTGMQSAAPVTPASTTPVASSSPTQAASNEVASTGAPQGVVDEKAAVTTSPMSDVPAGLPLASQNSTPSATKKSKSKLKLLLLAVVAILVIAGASAGAYFGVILPNKPEAKVFQGFMHLADQTKLMTKGRIDVENKKSSSAVKAVAIDYTMQGDSEAKAFDLSTKIGVMGITIPMDMRYIEEDMYIKVSGLESLIKVASSGSPNSLDDSPEAKQIINEIDDKWFVINRSLIQESTEASCTASVDLKLTDEDLKKIEEAYRKNPLFSVKSQSEADVDGTKTTKFELDPTDEESANNFGKEIESITIIENLKKCLGESNLTDSADSTSAATTGESKPQLFVYLTDDKQIKKLEILSDEDEMKMSFTAIFDYGNVTIQKPEDAKPLQDLLTMLMGDSAMPGMTNSSSGAGLGGDLFDAINL